MKLGVYAIRDVKTCFMSPTLDQTEASAIRNFKYAIELGNSMIHAVPQDFDLYQLGVFDTDAGVISAFDVPKHIVSGSSLVPVSENGDIVLKSLKRIYDEDIVSVEKGGDTDDSAND